MSKETVFNKEEFASLLDRAKGDRSINQYASETDISAAHISRFLRQMIDAPPTPETISKFAEKAYNGVTYRDMMIAAGHISKGNEFEEDSPINRQNEIIRTEQEISQIIIGNLMSSEFRWSMEKPEGRIRFPDLIINLEDDEYKRWYFEFRAIRGNFIPISIIYNFYGRLLTFELSATDKFTLVVNDKRTFNFMLERPPVNLRANLYVMLIDLESRRIIKEEKISEY